MSDDGGMADFLRRRRAVDACPSGTEVEPERAVLVEPFAVALHAVHRVPLAGRRVAVVGIGSLGLCVVEAAVLAGASEVVAVSRSERARELAREAGATAALPPDRAAEVDAEVVFETAGAAPAVAASFAAVRRGGRVVVLGGHPRPTGLDLLDLTVREVALEGSVSHCFSRLPGAPPRRSPPASSPGRAARSRSHRSTDGPALLRDEDASIKRILVPGLP